MPIQTDLSVSPYFDDYNENRDYYKILFRPGVSVQARELNQLQTMLQKQVERFGDNIFKRGTIVDGCDITFHPVFPYVKIRDVETDGSPVNISQYNGYHVKNNANATPLEAVIVTSITGFESRSPDLNTLYVKYLNSGYVANSTGGTDEQLTFTANQTLTVYDPTGPIEKVISYDDSAGFSNTDQVVFTSAIAIQNSTGGTLFSNNYYVNDHINNGTANLQVVAVDRTTNSQVVILRVKPRSVDLNIANNALWTLYANDRITSTNSNPASTATIVDVIGYGAEAIMRTGALGEIDQITITSKGTGYYVLPTVSIASKGATTGQIASANLVAQNYLTQITVANNATFPIGTGYAMSVGAGVIYQKGYFSRVNEHLVVVEKYNSVADGMPDQVAVGFDTTEEIINSNQDTSLLDNATGSPNETAPGANRLKLTPSLVVLSKSQADANSEFFSIAEFAQGQPYKQNRQTVYNIIGNEIARRTYEESGNYVLDQFIMNTRSPTTLSAEANNVNIVIDPGKAYVDGKRVETVANFEISLRKGDNTFVANNLTVSLNYGNYIRVKELGGAFVFKTGDTVDLYNTAVNYVSNTSLVGTVPAAPGGAAVKLGTARIRSFVHESGTPGTADATYRLYLFDIRLATAKNFTLIRSIYYGGATDATKGIADVVLEGGVAVLKDNNLSSLVYYAGQDAVKNANNISYIYRTSRTLTGGGLSATGTITFSLTGGETFPYSGTLSSAQEKELIITPLANAVSNVALSGTMTNTSPTTVTGTSTSFTSQLQAGDFIRFSTGTIAQVNNVANDTVFYTKNALAGSISGATANIYFPQFVPISLERQNRSASVDVNANTFTINIGTTLSSAVNVYVTHNVRSSNTTPVTKVASRKRYARLRLANNAANTSGPWCLGVSDVFRLNKVYRGANSTFTPASSGINDVTQYFYVDHNQTKDYYGISYLYTRPGAGITLANTDFLLVEIDYFDDSAEGLKAPGISGSYDIDDTVAYENATTTVSTYEIPEMYSDKGDYYDLRDQFDFRPQSSNTVALTTNSAAAPINPTEPSDAGRFSSIDKKFPAPDSVLTGVLEYYVGRADRVIIDSSGEFHIMEGTPGSNTLPTAPNNALTINTLKIPPYPSVPYQVSAQTMQYIDTKIANEKYTTRRLSNYRITTEVDSAERQVLQPRGYTMTDIGTLERRIADLEYYTSFTLLEAMAQKKVIPSSANNAIDRFKFGFFVDSFSTSTYSDTSNPGYAASVIDGRLVPQVEEINLQTYSPGSIATLPFVEHTLTAQQQATNGPLVVVAPVVPAPTTNNTTGTITLPPAATTPVVNTVTFVQQIVCVRQAQKTTTRSDTAPYVYEEFFYTMSEKAGPVNFFMVSTDNNVALEVFQSTGQNGPWVSTLTSATCSSITATDVAAENLTVLNNGRGVERVGGAVLRKVYGPVGGFVEDQFKISWSHNPNNGVYYKIRVYKGREHGNFDTPTDLNSLSAGAGIPGAFEYKMCYPIDVQLNSSNILANTVPAITTSFSMKHSGKLIASIEPLRVEKYISSIIGTSLFGAAPFVSGVPAIYAEQAVTFTATGLRPNTRHNVFIGVTDVTSQCKQDGGLLGGGIVTDINGNANFAWFYNSGIQPTTQTQQVAADINMLIGNKTAVIKNTDESSIASTLVTPPTYVQQVPPIVTTPPPAPAPTSIGASGGPGFGLLERFANVKAV